MFRATHPYCLPTASVHLLYRSTPFPASFSPREDRRRRLRRRGFPPSSRHRRGALGHRGGGLELSVGDLGGAEVRVEVVEEAVVVEVGRRVGRVCDRAGVGVLGPGGAEAAVGVERPGAAGALPGAAAGADGAERVVRAVVAAVGEDGVGRFVVDGRHRMRTTLRLRSLVDSSDLSQRTPRRLLRSVSLQPLQNLCRTHKT
ncbi:hypothetical protein VUR80DRAFT_299 [Thermomyces stellatus]